MLGAENVNTRSVLLSIEAELKVISDIAWKEKSNANSAIRGNAQGGNKLRTYSQFKHEYGTEPYVTVITRICYRSAYAKFRCGVAPIKIETCRYGLNRVPVEQRLCDECNLIEDEFHVIMVCTRYIDIRTVAMNAISLIDYQFSTYTYTTCTIYSNDVESTIIQNCRQSIILYFKQETPHSFPLAITILMLSVIFLKYIICRLFIITFMHNRFGFFLVFFVTKYMSHHIQ